MNQELDEIRQAQESEDHERARSLADAYVAAHPDEFTAEAIGLDPDNLPALVSAIDVFRAANMADFQWRCEAWLYHHFEPQNIGGDLQHQIRIPTR